MERQCLGLTPLTLASRREATLHLDTEGVFSSQPPRTGVTAVYLAPFGAARLPGGRGQPVTCLYGRMTFIQVEGKSLMTRKPFVLFEDEDTARALRNLSKVEHLVLYCGAGATIDRTGSSWEDLISRLVGAADGRGIDAAELDAVKAVVKASDGEEGGTLVWETLARVVENPHDSLDLTLSQILYEQVGWSHGLLLDNLSNLATMATLAGKRVTIVTTNYDVYIEEEVDDYLKELTVSARRLEKEDPGEFTYPVPGLQYQAFRRPGRRGPKEISKVVRKSRGDRDVSKKMIDIIYIHGRIGRQSNVGGTHVVLSEKDYAQTHDKVVGILEGLLGPDSGLLVLGSSLRDKPLLEALVKSSCPAKYALIRLSSWMESKGLALDSVPPVHARGARVGIPRDIAVEILNRRGSGLGKLHVISTENHEQISQFIEELRLAIEGLSFDQSSWPIEDISYSSRLNAWYEEWQEGKPDPHAQYDLVADFLAANTGSYGGYFDRKTRIEVWARPSGSPQERMLRLVCCTSGPLLKTHVPRECSLSDPSIAAARGFNEGRPLLLSLKDLNLPSNGSRWKQFLTVPIFAGVNVDFQSGYYAAAPVGAVVVASAEEKPRFATMRSSELASVVTGLVNLGLTILRGAGMRTDVK
jgi:hypothetical protein